MTAYNAILYTTQLTGLSHECVCFNVFVCVVIKCMCCLGRVLFNCDECPGVRLVRVRLGA